MRPGGAVLFRCDADEEVGLGHASRCVAIAEALSERSECAFAMRRGPVGRRWLEARGYEVHVGEGMDRGAYSRWLRDLTRRLRTRVLVLDVRDDLPLQALSVLREEGVRLVTIDDASERRWLADEAFYPPLLESQRPDWTGFGGKVHEGWEWVVLRPEFRSSPSRVLSATPTVLVTMGGSDPVCLTPWVLAVLATLDEKFRTRVLLGPGFRDGYDAVRIPNDVEVVQEPASVASVLAGADLAIASFGVTAFELAALGVPAIHLSLTEDHAGSAEVLAREGLSLNLGLYGEVSDDVLRDAVTRLLRDPGKRAEMARCAKARIDGRGAERIAERIFILAEEAA